MHRSAVHVSMQTMNKHGFEQLTAAAKGARGSKRTLTCIISTKMTAMVLYQEKGIDLITMQRSICPHICHNIM